MQVKGQWTWSECAILVCERAEAFQSTSHKICERPWGLSACVISSIQYLFMQQSALSTACDHVMPSWECKTYDEMMKYRQFLNAIHLFLTVQESKWKGDRLTFRLKKNQYDLSVFKLQFLKLNLHEIINFISKFYFLFFFTFQEFINLLKT